MEELATRLAADLGESRGKVIAKHLLDTRFLQGSNLGFRLRTAKREDDPGVAVLGDSVPLPELTMEVVGADSGAGLGTDSLAVRPNQIPQLLERFEHVLEVESAEELMQLFQLPAGE